MLGCSFSLQLHDLFFFLFKYDFHCFLPILKVHTINTLFSLLFVFHFFLFFFFFIYVRNIFNPSIVLGYLFQKKLYTYSNLNEEINTWKTLKHYLFS